MVNEINKPKVPPGEYVHLGQRLAASNQQLREMQEEHRQLVHEMETLRQRAAELSRLNGAQQNEEPSTGTATETATETTTETASAAISSDEFRDSANSGDHNRETTALDSTTTLAISREAVDNTTVASPPTAAASDPDIDIENATADDLEAAEDIRQKVEKIAAMKAQFKRIENTLNTARLIEQHLASKTEVNEADANTPSTSVKSEAHASTSEPCSSAKSTEPAENTCATFTPTIAELDALNCRLDASTAAMSAASAAVASGDESLAAAVAAMPDALGPNANDELVSTMMNMFTDFTADLRSQADNLRAERERIRLLKEDLLRRKRQS